MAKAASPSDANCQLASLVECPVCRDVITDPRQLPCIHSYCLQCIEGFSRDKLPGDEVACPLCRNEFEIPSNGLNGLPKNFFIEQLKQELQNVTVIPRSVCVECRDKATMICQECAKRLCDQCADMHIKQSGKALHWLRYIDETSHQLESNADSTISGNNCEKHSDSRLDLYCVDCKLTFCNECLRSHKGHECLHVNDVAAEFKFVIAVALKGTKETIDKYRKYRNNLMSRQSGFRTKLSNAESAICEQAEKLKDTIEQQKNILLQKLKFIRKNKEKEVNNVIVECEQHIAFAESFISYSDELSAKGTASEIARQISSIRGRANDLMKCDVIHRARSATDILDVKFTANTSFEESHGGSMIGSISLHLMAGGGDGVGAMTSLNDKLYVARHCTLLQTDTDIEVYDAECNFIRLLNTDQCVQFYHTVIMTSCAADNCLYVCSADAGRLSSSYDGDCWIIYKIDVLLDRVLLKWEVENEPRGLSVNKENNLIVAGDDLLSGKLLEYSRNGSLLRKIRPQLFNGDCKINSVWHAIQLTSGQFVVSCGIDKYCGFNSLQLVCLVDGHGRVVVSYRSKPGSADGVLNKPIRLAVDKNGFIFVAPSGKNRITVLTPSLGWSRDLYLPFLVGGLQNPHAMFLDESRGRLYVGEGRRSCGRVLVLDNLYCVYATANCSI